MRAWVRTLLTAAFLSAGLTPAVMAAPVAWDGQGDGVSWGDLNNWFPAAVPGIADDVTISSGVTIVAGTADFIQINSIILGDGTSTPTLRIATGMVIAATFDLQPLARLQFDTTQFVTALSFIARGTLTHTGPVEASTVAVSIDAGLFDLQAGASVTVIGKGLRGGWTIQDGFGPGFGGRAQDSRGAGGAGYGSPGGDGGNAAAPFGIGGSAHDSPINVASLGSGGGGGTNTPCSGGDGGGLFRLFAVTATIQGRILADGTNGATCNPEAAGGGSGGGVLIRTENLYGTGSISAAGSFGGNGDAASAGGGAGGRISISVSGVNASALGVSAPGGAAGTLVVPGVAGQLGSSWIDPKIWMGNAGGSCTGASNWYGNLAPQNHENLVFGSTNPLVGCNFNNALAQGGIGSITMLASYQGILQWDTNFTTMSGNFIIQGGSFSSNGFNLTIGGDWTQTGGVVNLDQGAVLFTSNGGVQTITSQPGAFFNDLTVAGAGGSVSQASDVDIRGSFIPGTRWQNASGGFSLFLGSNFTLTVPQPMGELFWVFDSGGIQTVSPGPYYGLIAQGGGSLNFAGVSDIIVGAGGLRIDRTFVITSRRLELAGSLEYVSGSFATGASTVAFISTGTLAVNSPGVTFNHIVIGATSPAQGGSVLWLAPANLLGDLTLQGTGQLSLLNGSTLTVRGNWTHTEGAVFNAGSGAVIFDGPNPQVVFSSGNASFNNFLSSNAVSVTLSTGIIVDGNLEMHRALLDFSSMSVQVRGDFLSLTFTAPAVLSSTIILDGTNLQTISLGPGAPQLGSLLVANSGSGVVMASDLALLKHFTVLPGAVFDGADRTLSMLGDGGVWSTAGADYRSNEIDAHTVRWDARIPSPGTIFVAPGSTVNARVETVGRVVLQGDFNLVGTGNTLRLEPGSLLDASGSTITLRGTSDISVGTGTAFVHDAGSWIVYESTGSGLGVNLSTGPFGNIRFRPGPPGATFRLGDIVFDGDVVIEAGIVLSSATLSIGGDLINTGGVLDVQDSSTGTVRLFGASPTNVSLLPGDFIRRFLIETVNDVQLQSDIEIKGELALASGTLRGGSAKVILHGSWAGTGGSFQAENSTVTFSAAAGSLALSDSLGPVFNGIVVDSPLMIFNSTFTAAVLTSTKTSSTMRFAPNSGADYVISDLRLNGGNPGTPLVLRSTQPGVAFDLNVVSVSTITAVDVADSNAVGVVIQANDTDSVDSGNNTNWNFLPALAVVAPGETFVEGVGKVGAPNPQLAGTGFMVTVRSVSDRFRTVPAVLTVTMTTTDPFDTDPLPAPLTAGVTTFFVTFRTAEPAPLATTLSATSPGAFGAGTAVVDANPAPFSRLQLLVSGELPQPGSGPGKTGAALLQTKDSAFGVQVRATDPFWNLITAAPLDTIQMTAPIPSSATLPVPAPLASGIVNFAGLAFHSTGTVSLSATDISNFGIMTDTSPVFPIFAPSLSSPTVSLALPPNAVVATLSGGLSGTASDAVAVVTIGVALREISSGFYFDWPARTFTSGFPVFQGANLAPINSPDVNWDIALADIDLADQEDYLVVVKVTNPAANIDVLTSSFTFDTGVLGFNPGDGEGTAVVLPASAVGCGPIISTLTFTVGPNGIGAGGAVAVRVPEGWTVPQGLSAAATPPLGKVKIQSLSAAWLTAGDSEVLISSPSLGNVALGPNWIVLRVLPGAANNFLPAETIDFIIHSFPPPGPAGVGTQFFDVRSQGDGQGNLLGIADIPAFGVAPGPPRFLRFDDYRPLTLGPLQTSPTMQFVLTDRCGNPTVHDSAVTVGLSAGVLGAGGTFNVDAQAQFFAPGGASIGTVTFSSGSVFSSSFYYRSSTSGISFETLRATAVIAGFGAAADRLVFLREAPIFLGGVSIDTGSLVAGATSAMLVPGGAESQVVIRFDLSDPKLRWEVAIATDAGFGNPLFRRTGSGDMNDPVKVVWNGVNCGAVCRFADPGVYPVRIRAAGGASVDTTLEVRVVQSPLIFGDLGAGGAGALVRVEGPGAGLGHFTAATATGYYQIFGLQAGQAYRIFADTEVFTQGRLLSLSTATSNIVASLAGTDAGTLSFPTPSFLRVNVNLPILAPHEFWGTVFAHNADFTQTANGTLRLASGAASSDNGGTTLGQTASTWTLMGLPPGTYDVEIALDDIGITTRATGVVVTAGGFTDLSIFLLKKANLFGYAILPSTQTFGSWISVQARRAGDVFPSIFGGGFVPPPSGAVIPTSASYRLFGLGVGTWTITAQSQGFLSTSAVIFVSGPADIGDPQTFLGGLDLPLRFGQTISGALIVHGDSTPIPTKQNNPAPVPPNNFFVHVQAFNAQTLETFGEPVQLSADPTVAQATYGITGLPPGDYEVQAFLYGFEVDPPGALSVSLSSAGGGTADIDLVPNSARIKLEISIPPLPSGQCHSSDAFKAVSLFIGGPDVAPEVFADITALDGVSGVVETFYCSTMTFLSPPLGTGFYNIQLMHGPSGNAKNLFLPAVNRSTATAFADLAAATFTVSGTVSVSGNIVFQKGSFAVSVSSVPGLIAHSAQRSYCLLSSSNPVVLSAAHVELLPVDPEADRPPGPLLDSSGPCDQYLLPPGPPPSLIAYAAPIQPDGSYVISGVPAGAYLLRNVQDLDDDPSNGTEAALFTKAVLVSTDTTVDFELGQGVEVRGTVRLPAGVSANRPVEVNLLDRAGRVLRRRVLHFRNGGVVSYAFDRVPDGGAAVTAEDRGYPRRFAAKPLVFRVAGENITGQDIRMLPGGSIRGRIAVEKLRPDGTREFALVTPDSKGLLPRALDIFAVANPWVQGGFFEALGDDCGSQGCETLLLDGEGRFTIPAVLPGVYDLEFNVFNDEVNARGGALDLVSAKISGVRVAEGQIVDAGTILLRNAASLLGRVTDASTGLPAANVPVSAFPAIEVPGDEGRRRRAPRTRTDRDGKFVLRGLDPRVRYYDVIAAGRFKDAEAEPVPYEMKVAASVDLQSPVELSFSLIPAPYTLRGSVFGIQGDPLFSGGKENPEPGALLFLQKDGVVPTLNPVADIVVPTNPDGSFSIPALAPGGYRLSVTALEYVSLSRSVVILNADLDLGALTLDWGASLEGRILNSDGTAPSEDEVELVIGATPDLSDFFIGTLSIDPNTRTISGYRLSGFKQGAAYRVILVTPDNELATPEGAQFIVFESSQEARNLDLVFRRRRPFVLAKAVRSGTDFLLDFRFSQPLRSRGGLDDDLSVLLSTVSALGAIVDAEISPDRRRISARYVPGAGETSFTIGVQARSAVTDPDSIDAVDPEFLIQSTVTFFAGLDGYHRTSIPNLRGGRVAIEGDGGRVTLPKGAFFVDASSSVVVTMQRSDELLSGAPAMAASGYTPEAANLNSLRMSPQAYPGDLLKAMAATPPQVNPFSAFYNIFLPLGVQTALANPVQLTVEYSSGTDPSTLNIYWYNPAANAYILQQDVTGTPPVIDTVKRTITININHFSTFVAFNTGVAIISGNAFSGGVIEAFNFPNPFDLSVKTVTPIHGIPQQTVRGTMIRFALPPGGGTGGKIHIFNVAGERVRTIELGSLSGGQYYYQGWDGRNDTGRDVASGVYIGQVKVGDKSAFFKMALIK